MKEVPKKSKNKKNYLNNPLNQKITLLKKPCFGSERSSGFCMLPSIIGLSVYVSSLTPSSPQTNSQSGLVLPTTEPSGHINASLVQPTLIRSSSPQTNSQRGPILLTHVPSGHWNASAVQTDPITGSLITISSGFCSGNWGLYSVLNTMPTLTESV